MSCARSERKATRVRSRNLRVGGAGFQTAEATTDAGAPFFAWAKGGYDDGIDNGRCRTDKSCAGSIAAHPCKKRKDGAPSVGMVQCKDGPPAPVIRICAHSKGAGGTLTRVRVIGRPRVLPNAFPGVLRRSRWGGEGRQRTCSISVKASFRQVSIHQRRTNGGSETSQSRAANRAKGHGVTSPQRDFV